MHRVCDIHSLAEEVNKQATKTQRGGIKNRNVAIKKTLGNTEPHYQTSSESFNCSKGRKGL